MKNSFCRICRGRFNLKYPPAAVDSGNKKPSSRTIAIRVDESGEVSGNICWDCEDTLLGFHKSVGEDNEDEPVVVDDDEILYKSLEKTRSIQRLSREAEIIQIDSSDSEHEERVTVPKADAFVKVESASTVVGHSIKNFGGALVNKNTVATKKNTFNGMNSDERLKKDNFTRGKVFESMRCPLCPYLSGIEYEVVFHIRHSHPQYTGEHLRFEQKEGDSALTRRIIFVHLWTFFECKACGKIHDRFWPHRKHLTAHDRKYPKNCVDDHIDIALNNNEVFISHEPLNKVQTSKRALEIVENVQDKKNPKIEERVLRRASKDNNSSNETPAVKASKSSTNLAQKQQLPQCHSVNKKSKSQGLLRKQQMLQARRERRRQKKAEEKKAKLKAISKPVEQVISKPMFKMPQQPAPRAASIVKQQLHQPRFTCKLCSQVLTGFISWNMHMMRLHSTVEFKRNTNTIIDPADNVCKKCDKRFASGCNLRMHFHLSHRRKNRLVEINGNDNEEICRQTLTPKKDSKDEEQESDKSLLPPLNEIKPQPDKSLSSPLNGVLVSFGTPTITSTSALLCQYCGTLFAALAEKRTHESNHIASAEVMRIFKAKSQA